RQRVRGRAQRLARGQHGGGAAPRAAGDRPGCRAHRRGGRLPDRAPAHRARLARPRRAARRPRVLGRSVHVQPAVARNRGQCAPARRVFSRGAAMTPTQLELPAARVHARMLPRLLIALAVALAALLVAVAAGAAAIPLDDVVRALLGGGDATTRTIILELRLPRATLAFVAGGAL